MVRGDARERLLDAAVKVILEKGYEAMRVDDVCSSTGLTKGAIFHHFKSKQDLAIAAAEHFAGQAAAFFAAGSYHQVEDPRERLLAYVDQRKAMVQGDLQDFTCLFGMMAQETYSTHPKVSAASGEHILDHASSLVPTITAADQVAGKKRSGDAKDLSIFIQAVVQGAFVIAKSQHDPKIAVRCLDLLKDFLALRFSLSRTHEAGK